MSAIRSSTGLASGLDIEALASALVARQQAVISRVQQQSARFEAEQTALSVVEAAILRLETSAKTLADADTFREFEVTGAPESVRVEARDDAIPGGYTVEAIRLASAQTSLSRGFASPEADLGGGTVTVRTGGELSRAVDLDLLNGGTGVVRGTVRLTDRAGATADVDLSAAVTVTDVLDAINDAGVGVTARAEGDRLVLTDTSGGAGTLSAADVTGSAAAGLGIAGAAAGDALTGADVFAVTADFGLTLLNDGLGPQLFAGAPDVRVTAADGSTFDVTLDDAGTVGGVADAINAATGGAVTASLANDRLVLTDTTGGGGPTTVEDINGSFAAAELGLDVASAGGVLTGRRLSSGLNSTLLRNLNGGGGVATLGTLTLTDRAGEAATVDLSAAETLDDVVAAVNGAVSGSAVKLGIVAEVDAAGTGLVVRDTTGGAGNLVIADGTGTAAADLGIAVNAAADEVAGGPLNRRFVGNGFGLAEYARDGQSFEPGTIQITDSAGNTAAVTLSSAVRTVGDAITRINAASGVGVEARLNETGDGFTIVDIAGGAGTLSVAEVDATTAADLRLDAAVTTTAGGQQQISSRFAAVVELAAGETLADLQARLGGEADFLRADVLDDGSAVASTRLSLTSRDSGRAGRLFVETDGIDLGLAVTAEAEDALARFGPGGGFLVTSGGNRFEDVPGGFDLELLDAGGPARIEVAEDRTAVKDAVRDFVDSYNAAVEGIAQQTRFDADSQTRGTLQGDGFVLRVENRLRSVVTSAAGDSDVVRDLSALGVRFTDTGELEFDEDRFDAVAASDPQELERFFAGEGGFGGRLEELVSALTDSSDGEFTVRRDTLDARIGGITDRVDSLTELMLSRRERLFSEFVRMEQVLASLQSQQQTVAALGGIRPIAA